MLDRIGVGSYAYRWSIGIGDYRPIRPMAAIEFIERAASFGAELVQIADNVPGDWLGSASLDSLRDVAEATSVAIELGTSGANADNLLRYLGLATSLGAELVRVNLDAKDLERSRDDLAGDLQVLGTKYERAGCVLAIENHFLLPSRDLADLIVKVDHPAVGVCLDVANSIANVEWPDETVAVLARHAVNLHLKDYRIDVDPYGVGFRIVGAPIGEGLLAVDDVLAATQSLSRQVNVVVEHWIPRQAIEEGSDPREVEDRWTTRSLEAVRTRVPR